VLFAILRTHLTMGMTHIKWSS